jgi:hypothetical protein
MFAGLGVGFIVEVGFVYQKVNGFCYCSSRLDGLGEKSIRAALLYINLTSSSLTRELIPKTLVIFKLATFTSIFAQSTKAC